MEEQFIAAMVLASVVILIIFIGGLWVIREPRPNKKGMAYTISILQTRIDTLERESIKHKHRLEAMNFENISIDIRHLTEIGQLQVKETEIIKERVEQLSNYIHDDLERIQDLERLERIHYEMILDLSNDNMDVEEELSRIRGNMNMMECRLESVAPRPIKEEDQ